MVMKSAAGCRALPLIVGSALLLVAAVAFAQNDVTSPAERFEKGLKFLKDHDMSLVVQYVPKDSSEPTRQTITAYYEMVMLANKKVDVTVFVVKGSGEEVKIAQIPGREIPSKGMGAWLWYKICAAVGQLDACREVGIVSSAS
jgi:hypothetical protein